MPCELLNDNLFLLPTTDHALDLACGFGHNALVLAKQGLTVQAWDISDFALSILQQQANTHALSIKTSVCEINIQSFIDKPLL